ncbi:GFA family protein [Trinickia diaoshuihuensis]|uniref:GFA family protein n=1 Tax=Trinickia diaoshuihuensis TaxID=2292265 RepID=UPI000E27DA73|nr:GFA family protein [Trinickia diaoshuihuensis]
MNADVWKGSCHCGTVRFEVRTPLSPANRCNCSLCRRKGVLMTPPLPAADLTVVAGREALTLYQFNSGVAKHYFCKHCGIHPFHQTLRDSKLWRVNINCLEGVDPHALEYSVLDGASLPVAQPSV